MEACREADAQHYDDGISHVHASKGEAKMETFSEDHPPMVYIFTFLAISLYQWVHCNKDGDDA